MNVSFIQGKLRPKVFIKCAVKDCLKEAKQCEDCDDYLYEWMGFKFCSMEHMAKTMEVIPEM